MHGKWSKNIHTYISIWGCWWKLIIPMHSAVSMGIHLTSSLDYNKVGKMHEDSEEILNVLCKQRVGHREVLCWRWKNAFIRNWQELRTERNTNLEVLRKFKMEKKLSNRNRFVNVTFVKISIMKLESWLQM